MGKENIAKRILSNIFLGSEYESEEEFEKVEPQALESEGVTNLADIRSRREGEKSKILNFRNGAQLQVMITYPKDVTDASSICDYIRNGSACVVNLEGVDRDPAQRIADFLGGAVYIVNGVIQRVSNTIFIAAPDNVHISGEIEAEVKAGVVLPMTASFFR